MRQLPHEDVLYLADTARVPYGGRSPEEIIKINQEIIPFLIEQGAKLIIIACGTSSAIAYPVLQDSYPVTLISLIEPGARAALASSTSGNIGVIATVGTINSQAYQNTLKAINPKAHIFAEACPLFVPLIEGGFFESDETTKVAKDYLKPLLKEKIDALILGCTHYPHLAQTLGRLAGPSIHLIDPAVEAVHDAKLLLKKAGTLRQTPTPARYDYFVTGSVNQFEELGSRLLGKPITHTKLIKF